MATAPSPPRCEGSFYGLSHRLVFDLSRATSPTVRWVRGAVFYEGGGGGGVKAVTQAESLRHDRLGGASDKLVARKAASARRERVQCTA